MPKTLPPKHPWEDKVRAVFEATEGHISDLSVSVEENDTRTVILVSAMYEYLPLNLQILLQLAEVFGTQKFDVDKWHSGGCETCDYGYSYTHEFVVRKGQL